MDRGGSPYKPPTAVDVAPSRLAAGHAHAALRLDPPPFPAKPAVEGFGSLREENALALLGAVGSRGGRSPQAFADRLPERLFRPTVEPDGAPLAGCQPRRLVASPSASQGL